MNPSNRLLASVAGVCIASAVVVGAVLGSHGSSGPRTPAQRPAGNPTSVAPSTVTVTAAARPAPVTSSTVRPSTSKPAAVVHRRHAAVPANQEPNVTDPTTSAAPEGDSTLIDQGPGVVDESGIRRAPAPTGKHSAPPQPVLPPRAPELSPSDSSSN